MIRTIEKAWRMLGALSGLWEWAAGLGAGLVLWTTVSWLRSHFTRLDEVDSRLKRVETDLRQYEADSSRFANLVEAATRRSEEASNRSAQRVIQTLANFQQEQGGQPRVASAQFEALGEKLEAVLGRIRALEERPAPATPEPRVPEALATQMAELLQRIEAYRNETEAGRESLLHAMLDQAEDTRLRLQELGDAVSALQAGQPMIASAPARLDAPVAPAEPEGPYPTVPEEPDESFVDIVTAATRKGWSAEPTLLLGEVGGRAASADPSAAPDLRGQAIPEPAEEPVPRLDPLPFPTLIPGGVAEDDGEDLSAAALLQLWNEGPGTAGVERHLDFVRGRVAGHWSIRPLAAYRDRIYLAENLRARAGESRFLLLPRIGSWCTDVADVFDVSGLFAAHAYALKGYVVSSCREPARFWTEVGLIPERIGPERLDHEDLRRGSVEVRAVQ